MTIAITRAVSARFNECELTHIERAPIDVELAGLQHRQYVSLLAALGCQVVELESEPDLADSVFVEDTAFILPELAVITRPGARSRRAETTSIIRALSPYLPLAQVTEPATLDGGDVLILGKNIYVGKSTRSTPEAISQIQEFVRAYGYSVSSVEMHDCLHLKSAVTNVDEKTLLINPLWIDHEPFKGFDWITVDPAEPFAANCLPIGNSIVYPTVFPITQNKLEKRGFKIATVDVTELAKAEGAVTCCSLIVPKGEE